MKHKGIKFIIALSLILPIVSGFVGEITPAGWPYLWIVGK